MAKFCGVLKDNQKNIGTLDFLGLVTLKCLFIFPFLTGLNFQVELMEAYFEVFKYTRHDEQAFSCMHCDKYCTAIPFIKQFKSTIFLEQPDL